MLKVSLTVNSLDIIEFILGTTLFAILHDGVPIAIRMGLNEGRLSNMLLHTKTIIPGLESTTLNFLWCSTLKVPDDLKDFKYSLIGSSWFTVKFSKLFLVSPFYNLALDSIFLD